MSFSMNSARTENCNSFHPGMHAVSYFGDGNGRDYGICRSAGMLHGTSQGGMTIQSKPIGLPRIPAPVQTEKGHPPGYGGHVRGSNDSLGETYGSITARSNTQGDDNSNGLAPASHMQPFTTTSGAYGGGAATEKGEKGGKVPPLSLADGKTGDDLEATFLLNQYPPRAKPLRSARFNTRDGFSESQLDFVRRLDLASQHDKEVLAQDATSILVLIPVAAKVLGIPEERVRISALSVPGSRLVKDVGYCGSLAAVAIPQDTWNTALDCISS